MIASRSTILSLTGSGRRYRRSGSRAEYVTERLKELAAEGLVDPKRCLFGFPHPSGANGHRKSRFEEQREALTKKARAWFSRTS